MPETLRESGCSALSPSSHSFHLIPIDTPKYTIPIFQLGCVRQTGPGTSQNDSLEKDLSIKHLQVSFSIDSETQDQRVHGLVGK